MGEPATEAGRRLLASSWALGPGEPLMADTILAIEAAARAEALAELRQGIAALENPGEVDSAWRWGFESAVIRVLALLEPPK